MDIDMKNLLVTGGAGFIGSNFIDIMLEKYCLSIINLDLLTYAGNLDSLRRGTRMIHINLYGQYMRHEIG